ncbi:TPA: hypothetical protein ACT19S_003230 [Klebsiella pneumoniae]
MLKITEAYKTAVISTAHVTAEDSEQLPIACFDPITDRGLNWVHGTEYGWIVRVGMRDNSWADELRTFNISEAAIANIKMMPVTTWFTLTVMPSWWMECQPGTGNDNENI